MQAPGFVQWRSGGERFSYRGYEIFLQAGGSKDGETGTALLCIHGFPTASWDWHRLWPSLCGRFGEVLAPDLIGFGWSAKPRLYEYSIFDQADLLEALLRARNVRRCHILAHDYGDTVAQELLARHRERSARGEGSLAVESVCFLNGGLIPEANRPRAIQRVMLSPLGPLVGALMNERWCASALNAVFAPATRPTPAEMQEFWQLINHEQGQRITHQLMRYVGERREFRDRWVGALQSTAVPCRFIDGTADPVAGAKMVARYRAQVPAADVVELPGIGHYPQVEQPGRVWQAFAEFHDRLAARV